MRRWVEIGDIDGFNLPRTVAPESLRDFVDLVVPVLQEQGLFKHDYARGSLREKLFETDSPHIDAAHPAARFRRPA
jgi:hypothetical protein